MQQPIVNMMIRSAGAASLSQVWRLGVTFGTYWVLRHLIAPAEMGPWNWAEPAFLVLAQMRDAGLPGHMVRENRRLFGNFFRVELLWGGALALLIMVGAPYLRLAYSDGGADFEWIVRAFALFFFIQGLGSVPLTYLEAELRVDKAVPAELMRNTVFATTSIGLALAGYGVWSMIVGHLLGASIFALMLWRAAWPTIDLTYVRGATGALIRLSWPVALLSLLEQTVLRLDTLVLAPRFDSEIVGFVGLSMYAVFFFPRLLAESIGRALYPALVRYRDTPERAFEAFRMATLLLLTFAVPTAFALYLNADWAVRFLGGEKWAGAAQYLRILSLVPLLRPFAMFGFELLLTRHRDRLLILYSTINLVAMGGLGWYLIHTDLRELGMAVAGYAPLGMVVLIWGLNRLAPDAFRRLLVEILQLYLIAAIAFVPVLTLTPNDSLLRLVATAAAGLVVALVAGVRYRSDIARFLEGP